jgi:acyl dehydratase
LQTLIQGTGLAMLEMSQVIHGPVRVNDSIHALITVGEVRPTSGKGRAVVASTVEVFNQREEKVMTYSAKRLLAGRAVA